MIRAQITPPFSDERTSLTFEGDSEEDAWNILATRLILLDYTIELWSEEEGDWLDITEADDGIC